MINNLPYGTALGPPSVVQRTTSTQASSALYQRVGAAPQRIGVDVSDYQDVTSFERCAFVVVKLGEGLSSLDVGANYAGVRIALAKRQRVPVAGYWFLHPKYSGQEQAKLAIERAEKFGIRGIACDAEVTDGASVYTVREAITSFMDVVTSWGHGLLYTNLDWANVYETHKMGYHLWESHPGQAEPDFKVECFQYSALGSVPGVSSPVDLDRWTGDDHFFDAFFNVR